MYLQFLNLGAELKSFKEDNHVDKLVQELEFEKQRNLQMTSEMQSMSKTNKGLVLFSVFLI